MQLYFAWKSIVIRRFNCVPIRDAGSVWSNSLSRGGSRSNYQSVDLISFIGLTLPPFCACLKPLLGFQTPYVMVVCVFNVLMVGVRFVDIGGIVANNCFCRWGPCCSSF